MAIWSRSSRSPCRRREPRPKLVVTTPDFRAARDTAAAQTFNRLLDAMLVMEIRGDLSRADAGESARALLAGVRDAIGSAALPR